MKKIVSIISASSLALFLVGCSENQNVTTPSKTNLTKNLSSEVSSSTKTPIIKRVVKKAPKRKVAKKRVVKKRKIKYVDTSESSKMRIYDPKSKKEIVSAKKIEPIPNSIGGKLFYDKGCNLCHKKTKSRLGPSLRKLSKGYYNKQNDLIEYLKRKAEPIIHPQRSSIMKSQLTKLRILSEEEYRHLSSYIISKGE